MKQDLKRIELNPRAEEGPHVSDSPEALRVDAPAFVPVQHYAWQDKGTYVQLQITTTHHLAGARAASASALPPLCFVSVIKETA